MDAKCNEKKIVVDGKTYVPEDSIQEREIVGDVKIVILQRGWVMVGRFERNGADCKLYNASVIRRWGTEGKGLGYIAKNGPTADTILDKCYGVVEFDNLTTVAMIACEESKWKKEL